MSAALPNDGYLIERDEREAREARKRVHRQHGDALAAERDQVAARLAGARVQLPHLHAAVDAAQRPDERAAAALAVARAEQECARLEQRVNAIEASIAHHRKVKP